MGKGNKQKPLVSVVIPVYKESNSYLKKSIESILNQTYRNLEIILIDDSGERGRVYNRLKSFSKKDKRVKLIKNKVNLGITRGLNKAIGQARGEFIARMDADDISEKFRIEKLMNLMLKKKDLMLAGSEAVLIDEDGKRIGLRKRNCSHEDIRRKIFLNNQFIHPSVILRKSILKKVGNYSGDYPDAEDYELFLRIAATNLCENIPEPLLRYRVHGNQITSRKWLSSRTSSLKARAKHLFKSKKYALSDLVNFILALIIYPIHPKIIGGLKNASN